MRGFPLQLLASCVLLAVTSGVLGGSKMPQQVLDLHPAVYHRFAAQPEGDVVGNGQVGKQCIVLEDHAAVGAGIVAGGDARLDPPWYRRPASVAAAAVMVGMMIQSTAVTFGAVGTPILVGVQGGLGGELFDSQLALAGISMREFLRLVTARFHLLNKAEQLSIAEINRSREATATPEKPRPESLEDAVRKLAPLGKGASDLPEILSGMRIEPTLTAHPTEARRVTLLDIQGRVARLLIRLERDDLTAALGTPPIGQVPALDDEPVDLHGLARVTAALRT